MSAKWDSYFWKDAPDVLKNKLGIKTPGLLEYYERLMPRLRAVDVPQVKPNDLRFEHLQAIHKHLFQDVYEWAGKVRDVALVKGGTDFAPPSHIADLVADFHKTLRIDPVSGKNDMVNRMIYAQSALNTIHPFRDGNGRATRAFLRQYAKALGFDYSCERAQLDRGAWNEANAYATMAGHTKPLRSIFEKNIRSIAKDKEKGASPETPSGGRRGSAGLSAVLLDAVNTAKAKSKQKEKSKDHER